MSWRIELPTVPGYYWHENPDAEDGREILKVSPCPKSGGSLCVIPDLRTVDGRIRVLYYKLPTTGRWDGPINPPYVAPTREELLAKCTERELHDKEMHPDWEYETTETARKSGYSVKPDGEGWEPNFRVDCGSFGRRNWERFDFTENEYWMRRKQLTSSESEVQSR